MKIDLQGLSNNPTPWRVYAFFSQGGGSLLPTPFGLEATFRNESDAKKYAEQHSTHRTSFRIVNEADLPNTTVSNTGANTKT